MADPVDIPFPLTSAPGNVSHDSAGRLLNAYAEQLVAGARGQYVWRRTPGLKHFATTAQANWRGGLIVGNILFGAYTNNVTSFTSAGVPTTVGALAGTAKVFWARNNKQPTADIMVVDPDNGASIVTTGSVVSATTPAAFNSICFLDGFFFGTSGDGRCFASDLNATTFNALSVITCEGKPDGLLRAVPWSQLYLCGTESIEVWTDTAEPPPGFPFSRLQLIPKGIFGRYCVTGFEDGIGRGIIFVGNDGVVYLLDGYVPTRISTPDVERAIEEFIGAGGTADQVEMFSYNTGGRCCSVLKAPMIVGATNHPGLTWVFDIDALHWHERMSYDASTATKGAQQWRASAAVSAFGKWICGDVLTGNLLEITELEMTEAGAPLIWQVESGPVSGFPNRAAVMQAAFDIAQGVGIATGADPNETQPTVMIQYSDDYGLSWSTPRMRKLERQNVVPYGSVKLTKCGSTRSQGRRWRLTVSDAVNVSLTGGQMFSELRRS